MILLQADDSPVYALAFSPDGERLLCGQKNGRVRLGTGSDLGDTVPLDYPVPFTPTDSPVNGADFNPGGTRLAVGGGMGWVARLDRPGGPPLLFTPKPAPRGVTAVRFLSETLLAVGTGDRARPGSGGLEVWDLAAQRPREPRMPAPDGVRGVATAPGLKRVAWIDWGRKLSVWDIANSAPRTAALPRVPTAVAMHPDGNTVAVAAEWFATVHDAATGQERFGLKGHKGQVGAIAYRPDGGTLATGSWDGTVRLWDARTGCPLAAYAWPVGRVCALAFAPDGLRLAVGGDRGGVAVFDVD